MPSARRAALLLPVLLLVHGPALAQEVPEDGHRAADAEQGTTDGKDAAPRGAKTETAAAADASGSPLRWVRGVHVELLGGVFAVPLPTDFTRTTVDPYLGARLGYRRQLGPIIVGGEGALRASGVSAVGTNPVLPLQLAVRAAGVTPNQAVRQSTQVSVGGTVAYRLKRYDWFVEPFAMAGLSHSLRTFLVELDSPIPFNRSFPTLGGYAGVGFLTGLEPVFFRMDALVMPELGPPPFTTRIVQLQYNLGVGWRF